MFTNKDFTNYSPVLKMGSVHFEIPISTSLSRRGWPRLPSVEALGMPGEPGFMLIRQRF